MRSRARARLSVTVCLLGAGFFLSDRDVRAEENARSQPAEVRTTLLLGLARHIAGAPEEAIRFDTAIALEAARQHLPPSVTGDEAFRRARARALAVAARDDDHPHHRLLGREVPLERGRVQGWEPPKSAGARRVNVNRVVTEALYCDRFGLRPETLAYIEGAMRDRGGYHTCHGLWALVIARDRGCLSPEAFRQAARPLIAEVEAGLRRDGAPKTPEAEDLFAERHLMRRLAGRPLTSRDRRRLEGLARKVARAPATVLSVHTAALLLWGLSQ